MGRMKRTPKESKVVHDIQGRLADLLRRKTSSGSDYALAKLLKVQPNRVNEWFVKPMKAISLPIFHRIIKDQGLNADWVLSGEGPEHRVSDRPLKELGAALRDYLIDEIRRSYTTAAPDEIGGLLPSDDDLLRRLVRSYGEYVQKTTAANTMRRENALLREQMQNLITEANAIAHYYGRGPIGDAVKLIYERGIGKKALGILSKSALEAVPDIPPPDGTLMQEGAGNLEQPLLPVLAVRRHRRPRNAKNP
jgi:hypothetical protein